jgi:hypothetical protein
MSTFWLFVDKSDVVSKLQTQTADELEALLPAILNRVLKGESA